MCMTTIIGRNDMSNVFKSIIHTLIVLVFIFVAVFFEWNDRLIIATVIGYTIVVIFGRVLIFLLRYLKKRKLANKYFIELIRKSIENNDDFDKELFESEKIQTILSKVYLSFQFNIEDYDFTPDEQMIIQYAMDYKHQILAGIEQIVRNNQIEESKKEPHK